jgi:general transcriptional corepressor TUP1
MIMKENVKNIFTFKTKVESQILEFQTMKQTIFDLEMNYQNLKQQYEEEISRLRRKLEGKKPSSPTLPTPSLSNKPSSPTTTTSSSSFKSVSSSTTTTGSSSSIATTTTSNGTTSNTLGEKKKESIKFPSLALHSSSLNQQNIPSMPLIPENKEENMMPPFQEKKEEVKVENFEKKQGGNDWVVVYNPQVKTNVNINLFHNLEHQSVVCCVKFSKDGKKLATGSNKAAQIFDVETGKKLMGLPEIDISSNKEDSYVRSVCFSPDGNYLVSGAEDKTVKVWDIEEKKLKYSLIGHDLDIYSLDYSCDNKTVVSGSGDGKAKIWNVNEGKCVHTVRKSLTKLC